MPSDPKQELLVAIAGPAVNFVLAGLLFGVLVATGWVAGSAEQLAAELSTFGGSLLLQLFAANIFLAVFNLIPAFPMDGGRVFRAILAMRLDYVRATQIAAHVGQFMAVLFGLTGLLSGNPLPDGDRPVRLGRGGRRGGFGSVQGGIVWSASRPGDDPGVHHPRPGRHARVWRPEGRSTDSSTTFRW